MRQGDLVRPALTAAMARRQFWRDEVERTCSGPDCPCCAQRLLGMYEQLVDELTAKAVDDHSPPA